MSILETFDCSSVHMELLVHIHTFTLLFVPVMGVYPCQKLVLQHIRTTHAHSLNLKLDTYCLFCLPAKAVFI